jgi:hypothetical protein
MEDNDCIMLLYVILMLISLVHALTAAVSQSLMPFLVYTSTYIFASVRMYVLTEPMTR